jgi:hypothetical protein
MRFTGNGSAFYDPSIFQYHFTARTVIDQDAGGKSSRTVVPLNLTACSFTTSQGNAGGSGICFNYNQSEHGRLPFKAMPKLSVLRLSLRYHLTAVLHGDSGEAD